jgi:hypothetical protein
MRECPPVTIAVFPVRSAPATTSDAVLAAVKPDPRGSWMLAMIASVPVC